MQQAILSWSVPLNPNGIILKYNVHQRETSNGKSIQIFAVEPEEWFLRLNVKSGKSYEWWMTAVNGAGESTPSESFTLTPSKTGENFYRYIDVFLEFRLD